MSEYWPVIDNTLRLGEPGAPLVAFPGAMDDALKIAQAHNESIATLRRRAEQAEAHAAALRRAAQNVLRAEAGEWDTTLGPDTREHMLAELADVLEAKDSAGVALLAEHNNAVSALRALEQRITTEATEIKALLIAMRRYFISHNCPTGECVAWNELKAKFGVGQRDEDDEAWMTAHTGKSFELRRSADERPRRRGE